MAVPKVICPLCGSSISKSNWSNHERRHRDHPETFEVPKYRVDHEGLDCKFCGKTCKNNNSLRNHERLCKLNPHRQQPVGGRTNIPNFNQQGRVAWNKGLTKETSPILKAVSEHMKEYVRSENYTGPLGKTGSNNTSSSIEVREKISRTMADRYAYPRGWAKRGWYKGIWCDSSWELAYILWATDNKISFVRNRTRFEYLWDGYIHNYTPDFYLPEEDVYIEIKGQFDDKAKAKAEQFPCKLVVYEVEEIIPILKYVEEKYGSNFTELYDECGPLS